MRSGALRHKVTIQSATETQDAFGEPDPTWGTFATVWASIEPIQGGERLRAGQILADIDHRIRMRYKSGVTPKMRVLFGSRIFDVKHVADIEERNREIELLAKEKV